MKINICIPVYDRPEFLRETVRTLNNTHRDGIDAEARFFVDRHNDPSVTAEVLKEARCLQIPHRIIDRGAHVGGSANNARGIIETYRELGGPVVYIESDILVCRGFFRFLRCAIPEAMKDGAVMQIASGPYYIKYEMVDGLHRFNWPSSIGSVFFLDRMPLFVNSIDEYLRDPMAFAESMRGRITTHEKSVFPNGQYFNRLWGGLTALQMHSSGQYALRPGIPRASHAGWYGWNANRAIQESNGISSSESHLQWTQGFCEEYDQ